MKHVFSVLVLALTLTACSGGGSGNAPQGGNDPQKPGGDLLSSCDNVITEELVDSFNNAQADYRIESSGYDMRCRAEVNVNGKKTTVERVGHPNIRVYPRLKFLGLETNPQTHKTFLRVKTVPVSENDVRAILKQINVPPNEDHLQYEDYISHADYARFEQGEIFYINVAERRNTDDGVETLLSIGGDDNDKFTLNKKLQDFANSKVQLEIMWRNKGQFYRQMLSTPTAEPGLWSNVDAADLLKSYIYKSADAGSEFVLKNALNWIYSWNLDGAKVNAAIPELYRYADGAWLNPTFDNNNISFMVYALDYLVKVNPNHSRKAVLKTYNQLNKYYDTRVEAMNITMDYLSGKLWSEKQFNQILNMADTLYPKMNTNSWKMAEKILKNANYDQKQADFVATAAFKLVDAGVISSSRDVDTILSKTYEKIQSGLTSANMDFYFQVYKTLNNDYSLNYDKAEKTTDFWVFSGRVTPANFSIITSFITWLKNEMYVSYTDGAETVVALVAVKPLDQKQVDLFKQTLSWLRNDLYINRSDALEKTKGYMIANAMTSGQFASLQALTNWFIGDLYINKSDALSKSENLIFQAKVTDQQVQVLKDFVKWLISDLYQNKSDSLARAEGYMFGPSPLTKDVLQQFKTFVNWMVSDLYLSKVDSLSKAEDLIIKSGLKPQQTELLKQAGNWLISDLYISKTEALGKAEAYLVTAHMTPQLFQALKAEYAKQVGKLNKLEALKKAENIVLGL